MGGDWMRGRRLTKSFHCALSGIWYAFRTQRNMRLHFLAALVVLLGAYLWALPVLEFLLLLTAVVLVLVTELVNTALEVSIDLFTDDYSDLARIAKNVAAGAVLIAALYALVVAALILLPRLTGEPAGGMAPGVTVEDTAAGLNRVFADDREYCPLSGRSEEKFGKPLVVMIDNGPGARPQQGLAAADIVYEAHVEGGITRIMAVYRSHGERAGPVRSARPYFVELAREYDPIFIHVGGSNEALSLLAGSDLQQVDELKDPSGFLRDRERRPPVNIFADLELIADRFEEQAEFEDRNPLSRDPEPENLAGAERTGRVRIISWGDYDVSYRYDSERGSYRRYLGDHPQREADGETLDPVNVIVQYVSTAQVDEEGRLRIETTGTGEALIFTGGWVVPAEWEKTAAEAPTRFYDSEGQLIPLGVGQTWIQLVPYGAAVSY